VTHLWFRVFGAAGAAPEPGVILEQAQSANKDIWASFRSDDEGWYQAELILSPENAPALSVLLERYLAREEGIRPQLNTWAAWLETMAENPNHAWLMEAVVQTQQLFTLQCPSEDEPRTQLEPVCLAVSRFLARQTRGVYQVDGQGFFAADGKLLVAE